MKKQKLTFKTKDFYNQLPIKVSRKNFNQYILPYLRKPIRGPDAKISYFKIFNYILYVLYTGCQWRQLPVYRNEISWETIYRYHNRWSKDGSYENLFIHSIKELRSKGELDLSVLHVDGSNTVAKKGAKA